MKLAGLLFASVISCSGAIAGNLVVDATADIYSAGQPSLPLTTDPGTFAPFVEFSAGPGQVLTFTSVTGAVGCNWVLANGPDGTCLPGISTTVTGYGGLSGISANSENFFLTGVFLSDAGPLSAAPPVLAYDYGTPASLSTSAPSYTPQVDQVFFIGDGLTGTGTGQQQLFFVPVAATSLYLGFADSFDSVPSYYADNLGSLDVDFQIATPEPATLFLSAAILLLVVVIHFGRNSHSVCLIRKSGNSTE